MLGSLDALFAATVLFVGGHFILSSGPVRPWLVRALGAQGFTVVYSLAVAGAFLWMLAAYGAAPRSPIWLPPAQFGWIPVIVMPFALVLAVAGVTTRSPTLGGPEKYRALGPQDPAPGILRITRHPFLWGATLWAVSHLLVNGDDASIVLFGGIVVLSLGGMWHIDQKRADILGSGWGPIALTTSVVPFAAILGGRTGFDWKGIGLGRVVAGLTLYAVLMYLHPVLIGVPATPAH